MDAIAKHAPQAKLRVMRRPADLERFLADVIRKCSGDNLGKRLL